MSPLSTADPKTRLRDLFELAVASSNFDELVIRIIAFRAYALALSDQGNREALADYIGMDIELVRRFIEASGNPAGLRRFLPTV